MSIALVACAAVAAVLWTCGCSCAAVPAAAAAAVPSAAAEGPSLSEMMQLVEPLGQLMPTDWLDAAQPLDEGRGKKDKGKPMKMAMMMAGTAAGSMMMMKAMGAIKLFIIHSFFATKLGLIVAAYLLLCKMAEMKKAPAKQTVKWVSPPSSSHGFDEHPPPPSMMSSHYSDPQPSSYEQPQEQPQQPAEQYGPPPSDQYGPPPAQHQQFVPSGDFGGGGGGGGGDLQAHYSHVSPVTYRPMIHRNQPDGSIKSSSGRIQ